MKTLRVCFSLLLLLVVASSAAAETMVPLMVKAGSSLIGLANIYCHDREDWRRIAEINKLRAPYVIREDTTLLVPVGLLLGENVNATIGAVRGAVRLSPVGMAPRPASTGDNVPPGTVVETGDDGYVLLIFPDQRFIRIDAGSRLRIDLALRLADGSVKIETTLEGGASLNNIKPGTQPNDSFILRTPTALTGVRGTEYRLKVDEDTRVETLRGEVYATAGGVRRSVPLGQGVMIGKKGIPSPPRPLPPPPTGFAAEEIYKNQPLHFTLPGKAGKETIRLTISRDEQRLRMVERRQGQAGQSLSVTLPEDGRYFLSLTAIDTKGFESQPTPAKAFVLRTSPGAPILTMPENAHFFTPSVPLAWSAPKDAAGYQVMVATDASFAQPLREATVATPSWHTPDLPLGHYYARVQSVAADGFQSDWSRPAAFTIAEPLKLFDNKLTADGPLHLRWNAMEEGAVYDLQVADNSDFRDPLVAVDGLPQPAYALKERLQPGVYYLRIRGHMPGTPPSPWGPPQQITIEQAPMPLAAKIILAGALILCIIL